MCHALVDCNIVHKYGMLVTRKSKNDPSNPAGTYWNNKKHEE
jgi:hypothetical protein